MALPRVEWWLGAFWLGGAVVVGPAIVAEDETSTLVGPGWTATVDARGYLDLRRGA